MVILPVSSTCAWSRSPAQHTHSARQQYGHPVALEATNGVEDLLDQDRREPHRWLVEQQQARLRIRPRPMASICCWPPDNVPAGILFRLLLLRLLVTIGNLLTADGASTLSRPRREPGTMP